MYLWSQWKHTGKMHIKKWVGARWRQKKFAYFWKKWVGGRGTRKKFAYFGRNRLGVRGSQKKFGYFGRKWVGGSIYNKNRFFHHLFRNFFPAPPPLHDHKVFLIIEYWILFYVNEESIVQGHRCKKERIFQTMRSWELCLWLMNEFLEKYIT